MEAELIPSAQSGPAVAPLRLLVGLLIALALGALIAWLVLSLAP
jgi:high-affinity Fe2+/Pb2+ permease